MDPERSKAPGVAAPKASGPSETERHANCATKRFAVVCQNDDGRRRIFGKYPTRAEAEHYASALRKIGCPAEIEEADVPEFGTSRRAFLIAMFACGTVKPERVVERVVAEINEESDAGS